MVVLGDETLPLPLLVGDTLLVVPFGEVEEDGFFLKVLFLLCLISFFFCSTLDEVPLLVLGVIMFELIGTEGVGMLFIVGSSLSLNFCVVMIRKD